MNKDEIMQVIAKTTAAIIALQAFIDNAEKTNTKNDPYMNYVCGVFVDAMEREREKQVQASRALVSLIAQGKGELS